MFAEVLLNGDVREVDADNAVATVALAAVAAQRHFLGGIEAHYTPAVAAVKSITITRVPSSGVGTVVKVYKWDFAKGPFVHNFPLLVHGHYNTTVIVALEASGTPGTIGTCAVWSALV